MPFKKGQSGNPTGRRRKDPGEVEAEKLAKTYTLEAVERLVHWMRSDNAKASVTASNSLLDRGHGKAKQIINATVEHSVTTGDAAAISSRLRPSADPSQHTVQ